jgi:hypothetical protein
MVDGKDLITIADTLKFKLDNRTSYRTFFSQAVTDPSGREFLLFLSQHKPSILLFDIKTQALAKEIILEKDGPNGVGSPSGLLFVSMDSIYVISSSHYKVSLLNGSGKLIKDYRVLEGTNYSDDTGMLRPFTISAPVLIENTMYFNVAPDRDVYKPSYFEGNVNLSLDLLTGEYEYFNHYPSEFNGGVWGVAAVSYSSAFNPGLGDFIYSFAISDSLYTFNPNTKERKSYFAGSSFIKSRVLPMNKPENSHDLEYALETPYYNAIVYDRYRNVYYRFVRHSISFKDDAGDPREFHEKPLSIIVLDKDMNILGETALPANTFLDYIYFVTTNGLYISNGNPENPGLEEDYACFIGFELSRDYGIAKR